MQDAPAGIRRLSGRASGARCANTLRLRDWSCMLFLCPVSSGRHLDTTFQTVSRRDDAGDRPVHSPDAATSLRQPVDVAAPEIGQLTNPSLSSRPSPELKTDREVRLEAKLQESRIANTGAVQDRKSAKAIPAGVLPTAQEIASSARSLRMEVCKAGFSTHQATWSRNRNFGCYYR